MKGLDGKSILVTGGSYGSGQAIAMRFAVEGTNVAINCRSHPEAVRETEAQNCAERVRGHGVRDVLV